MKQYKLEPALDEPSKYYILEYSENYTRTAMLVYYDIDLARRIVDILNNDLGLINNSV